MPTPFDPGYGNEPFRSLCENYPGASVYPQSAFRTEWGPIFHRGRLDDTARILVIGQDPAQHETIARRILVGVAGQRTQGLLAKLGMTRSYVMINTFLYSVYGNGGKKHATDPQIVSYRNQWLTALVSAKIEAVITLGGLAHQSWQSWTAAGGSLPAGAQYETVTHPTAPESGAGGDATKLKAATKALLLNWNAALQALTPAIKHPDVALVNASYGTSWKATDLVTIPTDDFPAGLPEWMHSAKSWAVRTGSGTAKRATITVTIPPPYAPK